MIEYSLPDLWGDELAPLVREAVDATAAVVIFSDCDTADVIERCVRVGADAFLPKPLGINTVSCLWQHCLKRDLDLQSATRRPACAAEPYCETLNVGQTSPCTTQELCGCAASRAWAEGSAPGRLEPAASVVPAVPLGNWQGAGSPGDAEVKPRLTAGFGSPPSSWECEGLPGQFAAKAGVSDADLDRNRPERTAGTYETVGTTDGEDEPVGCRTQ